MYTLGLQDENGCKTGSEFVAYATNPTSTSGPVKRSFLPPLQLAVLQTASRKGNDLKEDSILLNCSRQQLGRLLLQRGNGQLPRKAISIQQYKQRICCPGTGRRTDTPSPWGGWRGALAEPADSLPGGRA